MTSARRGVELRRFPLPVGAWVRGWFAPGRRTKRARHATPLGNHRLVFEPLEERQLLAGNILIATAGGLTAIPPAALTFSNDSNITIAPSALASAGANIDLEANNDITFQNAVSVQNGFALIAQASAAIVVNASVATSGANLTLDAGSGGIQSTSAGAIAASGVVVTLNSSGPIGSSSNRLQFSATPSQIIVGPAAQPTCTYLAGTGSLNLGNVTSAASDGPLDVTAQGNLTVLAGATLNTGMAALSLAADTLADGAGNDGAGTLAIQAGSTVFGSSINLRGAAVSIDPAATVGSPVFHGGVVTTIAGSAPGSSDGTGSAARFDLPADVAVDSAGNLYVADTDNCDIRKITPSGAVTTLAGSPGQYGSSDGTGSAASFGRPEGLAVDSVGNVYVADGENNDIRKITPSGAVTTLAGGQWGSSDGTGSAASFNGPDGVAVDSAGNVYVADGWNDEIRKITPAGVVTTLAGSPQQQGFSDGTGSAASFNNPDGVAVDSQGNVYVADQFNQEIRKISPSGVVTTLAGSPMQGGSSDGTGSAASFSDPASVAVDSQGNVYVADAISDEIRKVTPAGVVTTLAGSNLQQGSRDGSGGAASFFSPEGVAVDSSGNVYVADTDNCEIREITPSGAVTTLAGSSGSVGSSDGAGSAANFNSPAGVAVDSAGNLYVADANNDAIRKITPSGAVTTLAGSPGQQGSSDGTGSAARFADPTSVAVDSLGNVYVADQWNDEIREISPSGVVTTLAGSPGQQGSSDGTGSAASFDDPQAVAVDSQGNVYVADSGNDEIREISPSGVVTTLAGSPGQQGTNNGTGSEASFSQPDGVAVDSQGNVYVADNNSEIREISPSGVVTTLAGFPDGQQGSSDGTGIAASFNGPMGLAVDSAGNVYVADVWNDEIRKITPAGMVTTLAGSPGQQGFIDSTDSAATFNTPEGVAVDSAGNVYVADTGNYEIREITPVIIPAASQVTIRSSLPSRPMSIGGGASDVTGINLTDAELACIQTSPTGTVTLGDPTQTGNITFKTVTVATTTGAGTVVVQATGGAGQIILDDQGTGAALNGNGGSISLTAGTGGIVATGANDAFAEIATTGNVTLDTAGPIGTPSNRIQFDATATPAGITVGSAAEPAGTYLDGLGNLNLGNVSSAISNGPLDVTARGNLTVLPGATLATGSASLSLAADTQAGGAGNDGAGTLAIQPNSILLGSSISLRGAAMSIDPTARIGGAVSSAAIVVTTLAGSPGQAGSSNGAGSAASFDNPTCLATDSAGNVYVAEGSGDDIRKVTPSGVVTTLAGSPGQPGSSNGTGSAAGFDFPTGVAVDSKGNVYVADTDNDDIRKITPSGVVTTLAGSAGQSGSSNGTGSAARFDQPIGLAVDNAGNVYVAEEDNDDIRKITPAGVVTTLAGSAGQPGSANGTASAARFASPTGLALDSAGNIYVAEQNAEDSDSGNGNDDVRKISPSGVVTTLAGSGQTGSSDGTGAAASFGGPVGVAVDSEGNVYVGDTSNDEIRKISPSGVVTTLAGSPEQRGSSNGAGSAAGFNSPAGVAVDSMGNVYVADYGSDEVRKLTPVVFPATSQVTIRASLPSLPMSLGGGDNDVAGINLTDAELARIQTSPTGTVTIGDPTQTGNITFVTATPATTPGARTVVVQAAGGSGQIVLDEQGPGAALNGNGGRVQLTPGSGGVQVVQTSAGGVALASNGFSSPAGPLSLSLNFAPLNGAKITLVSNTATPAASNPISGTFSNLPQGGAISASYAGRKYSFAANYAGSDGNDLALSLTTTSQPPSATTTTSVVASANPSIYGQQVTFTATVTPSSGSGPSGTVQFQIDGANVGSPATLSGGTAACGTSTLAVGSHTVTAVYSGDGNFLGSTSPAFTETIGVPAGTILWTGAGPDNLWSDAANWSGDSVPGPSDDVVIGAGASVNATDSVTVNSLDNFGTLNFQDAYVHNDVELAGNIANQGTISVSQGQLSINPHGQYPNFTFTNSGTISIASGTNFDIGATFNPGNGTIQGSGYLILEQATASFNADWSPAMPVVVALSTITVNGTLTNTAGLYLTGSTIHGNVTNHGILAPLGFMVETQSSPAESTIDGQLALPSASQLILGGDQSFYDSLNAWGAVNSPNPPVFTAGSLSVSSGLTNFGTIEFSSIVANSERLVVAGTVVNAAGATISDQGNSDPSADIEIDAPVTNQGTITVTSGFLAINPDWGQDNPTYNSAWRFTNTGAIHLASDSWFAVGGQFDPSVGTIDGSGVLALEGTTANLSANWTPTVLVLFTNDVTLAGPGTLTIPADNGFLLAGSTINTAVNNQGILWVAGGANQSTDASAINGTLTTAAGSTLGVGFDSQRLASSSVFAPLSDSGGSSPTDASLTIAGGFTNHGQIEISAVETGSSLAVTSGILVNATGGTILSTVNAPGSTLTNAINANLDNQGTIDVTGSGLAINQGAATSACTVTNEAKSTIDVGAGQTLTIGGASATNNGLIEIGGTATVDFAAPTVTINGQGALQGQSTSTVDVSGSLLGNTTNAAGFSQPGTVLLDGSGTASSPQLLELIQTDQGNVAAGYASGFAYGTLQLATGTYVKLVNQAQNSPSAGAEAGYANSLVVPAGSTLDYNRLNCYAQQTTLAGTLLNVPTTTTLVSGNPAGSVYGQSVTFTATVSVASPGAGVPNGSVQFAIDGVNFGGPVALAPASAAATISTLPTGSHTVTATFVCGTSTFGGSSNSLRAVTVAKAGTTTTVGGAMITAVFGHAATFTATVAALAPGAGTPTGTVVFKDGAQTLGPETLNGGTASLTISTLTAGSNSITAVYLGDGNFTGSTSSAFTQSVAQVTPTITWNTPAAITYGTVLSKAQLDATAGVAGTFSYSPAQGAVLHVGTQTLAVTFTPKDTVDDTTATASVSLTVNQAVLKVTAGNKSRPYGAASPPLTYAITGYVNGDPPSVVSGAPSLATTAATASGPGVYPIGITLGSLAASDYSFNLAGGNLTVTRASTTTTIDDLTNPSGQHQATTFTAIVAAVAPGAGTPTGTVVFKEGKKTLGAQTLSGGTASFTISTLVLGKNSITAVYSGDGNFTASTSPADVHKVLYASKTALSDSARLSTFGQAATLSVKVTAVTTGHGTPTGTVAFLDGTALLGSVKLKNGKASLTVTNLAVGNHEIVAIYNETGTFADSVSLTDLHTVEPAHSTAALSDPASASAVSQAAAFAATMKAVAPGAGTPTGTGTSPAGQTVLGTVQLSGDTASSAISTPAAGQQTIAPVGNGDANFAASTSPADTHQAAGNQVLQDAISAKLRRRVTLADLAAHDAALGATDAW